MNHYGTGATRVKSLCVAVAGVLVVAACDAPVPDKPAAATAPSPATAPLPAGFDQTLSLQGITFHVRSTNAGSLNKLRIEPGGLTGDNTVIEQEIEGTVTMAEVADLDADGSPEV